MPIEDPDLDTHERQDGEPEMPPPWFTVLDDGHWVDEDMVARILKRNPRATRDGVIEMLRDFGS